MTDPADYTAKIRAKGLDGTGLTTEHAATLFNRVGHSFMAIVELQVVDKHGPNIKGQRGVELAITQVEPALDDETDHLEDHLRELTRTLYYNRSLDAAQPALDAGDGINPKVGDVISAGVRHRPHPYIASTLSTDDDATCDVCGLIEAAGVHSTQDFLPADDEDDEDRFAEPHDYEAGPDDSCLCGLAYGDPIHVETDDDDPEFDDAIAEAQAALDQVEEIEQRHLATVPNPFTP